MAGEESERDDKYCDSAEQSLTQPSTDMAADGNAQHDVTVTPRVQKKGCGVGKLVINIWLLSLGVSIAVAIYYSKNVTNARSGKFSPADMIDLGGNLGGFTAQLCEKVSLQSSTPFNANRLQKSPEIDTTTQNHYKIVDKLLASGDMQERSFYLLSGSVVNVSVCFLGYRPGGINITVVKAFLFKGESNFKKWEKSKDCVNCAVQVHDISGDMVCDSNKSFTFSLHVEGTDNYFIAFLFTDVRGYYRVDFGHIFYQLSLVRYDLSQADIMCNVTKSCDMTLIYATDQGVVLVFGTPGIYDLHIKSDCQLRAFYWVLMFGVIPVCVAALLTGCCCCLSRMLSSTEYEVPVNTEERDNEPEAEGFKTVYSTTDSQNVPTSVNSDGKYDTVYSSPEATDSVYYRKLETSDK